MRRALSNVTSVLIFCLLGGMVSSATASGLDSLRKIDSTPEFHGGGTDGKPMASAPSIQALVVTKDRHVYAGSFGMGVFRSEDRGQSWDHVNAGLTDLFLLCLTEGPDGRIYAGTVRGGIFRTTKEGTKWQRINEGLKRVEVKALLSSSRGIFAGTGRGVYQWKNRDKRWELLADELDQLLIPSLAMLNKETLLVATAGKGLLGYDLKGTQPTPWGHASSKLIDPKERLPHRYLRIVTVNPDQHIFLGTQDGGLFRSTDQGKSWHPVSRTLPNDSIRGVVAYRAGLFVATGRGIYKLNMQERRWKSVNTGLTELATQTLVVSHQGELYTGTSAGIFRSDNDGGQWVNVSEGLGVQTSQPGPY